MIQKVFNSVGLQLNYMYGWEMLLAALQAFIVVMLVVPVVRRSAAKRLANQTRHFHQTHREPISRLGGVALAAAFVSLFISLGLVYGRTSENGKNFVIISIGALAMFVLGLWDDLKSLGAKRKLLAQFLIALIIYKLGLRIELLETDAGIFFESGKPVPSESGRELLEILAAQLGRMPNNLLIEGHTDSKPFSSENGYSNWELSADRANSARKLMQASGIRPEQVAQVRGFADRVLRHPEDPTAASNRRISVIVQYQAPPSAEIDTATENPKPKEESPPKH